ncbi:fimbrial protein [Lysobacter soli]|uniref:fimbrial protein n=1 Tax=Lysobacter soli TaxID=453783 RepID=UPI00240F9ABD|nr:fimbrial protein [Lysobacter soli]MDG2519327.1 fimbrial protein [Lysobacter soli]
MKKTLLSTALVAVVAAVAMPSAFAATGKITINGELKAGTCAVTPGAGASGAASDMVVTLDPVQASALSGAASYAGTKAFDISVGGGTSDTCNGAVTKLVFENVGAPGSLINADGFLDNSSTGTATNVGVRLLNGNTTAPINLVTGANNPTATPTSGTPGVLKYEAQYFSKNGSATAGTVNTFVTYTVSY